MIESDLKRGLVKALRGIPGAVVYRHEDQFTAGMPDISVTKRGRVVWIEVKFDRNGRRAKTTPAQAIALHDLPGVLIRFDLSKDEKNTYFEGPYGAGYFPGFAYTEITEMVALWLTYCTLTEAP